MVPTRYVWSTGDQALGRQAAEATAEWVAGRYRFDVLDGVSHWVPEEAPDELDASSSSTSRRCRGRSAHRRTSATMGAMDAPAFGLTDTQREFRDTLRRFCEERIAPNAAEADRTASYPWKSFEACRQMELPALGLPAEFGGAGADHVTQAIAVEELARVCASTSVTMLISKLGMIPVMNWGSEELKRRYIPRIASGEAQASYCLSEADAGSDVAAMRCRAVRDGDHYVLTGSKYWITNAGISDTYTVFAKTDPDAGHRGVSCFLVEAGLGRQGRQARGQDGPAREPDRRDRPRRGPRSGVEPHRRGGPGFHIAMHTLDRSRPTIGAQAVGIAQGAIDHAAAT